MEGTKSPSPTLNAILSSMGVESMLAGSPTNSTTDTTSSGPPPSNGGLLPNGKKTKGRVKIKMEYIGNKLRRYTTFSKRKTGIMKKAYELSTLTGTQVMLLVASETGHVYTFATKKLRPMISSDAGKNLIQQCLSQPGEAGEDVQPSRSEFSFDMGTGTRKRRAPNAPSQAANGFDGGDNSLSSFLPTMVPTTLFQAYTDDDYANADDSEASDTEETMEESPLKRVKAEPKTEPIEADDDKDVASQLQQTLKEALKAARDNRATITAAKKRKQAAAVPLAPCSQSTIPSALLAPFLMAAAAMDSSPDVLVASMTSSSPVGPSSASSSKPSTPNILYAGSQGVVYAPDPVQEGTAGLLSGGGGGKAADVAAAQRLLESFPFQFNLQQFMENAALGAKVE